MKLKISGEITLPVLGEGFYRAIKYANVDNEKHVVRGATIYFNIYDRETGQLIVPKHENGIEIDEVHWLTAEEKEKKRQKSIKKTLKKRPKK